MRSLLVLLAIYSFSGFLVAAPQPAQLRGLDAYPDSIAKDIVTQAANERAATRDLNEAAQQYLVAKYRWPYNSVILVAFNGGSPSLHNAIVSLAREWTKYAKIELDFGWNPTTGKYRSWSPTDSERKAHIRIGFAEPGYWSALGKDSMIDKPFHAGAPSMNFGGFIQGWPNTMPTDWKTAVLHEFGHALGFIHEHQRESCLPQFRWTSGPGNAPDVYEIFRRWQGWNKESVDLNIKPIDPTLLNNVSKIDKKSIMYYAMPAQAYINGENSTCYLKNQNHTLSAGDAQGAMTAYASNGTEALTVASLSAEQVATVMKYTRKGLTAPQREALIMRVAAEREASKPLVYTHIQRGSDMSLANKIHRESIAEGFDSRGIEDMTGKGSPTGNYAQVRYFRDVDAGYARRQAKIVEKITGKRVELVKREKLASRAKLNMVEVWLP